MAIIATAGDSKTYTPAPEGMHQAVCVDVVDKGMLEVTYAGKTKTQHKIVVAWQLAEPREDGKRFVVFKRYTLSLNEKATLRKDLESWRGKKFTRDEEMGFDVEKLVGVNALLNVQHNVTGDKTYANVVAVTPLVKGMVKIAALDYVRELDRTEAQPEGGDSHAQPLTDDDIPFCPCRCTPSGLPASNRFTAATCRSCIASSRVVHRVKSGRRNLRRRTRSKPRSVIARRRRDRP
jgi:hypothetical protein